MSQVENKKQHRLLKISILRYNPQDPESVLSSTSSAVPASAVPAR